MLVALQPEDAAYFSWPTPQPTSQTVGTVLADLMAANGWPGVEAWIASANDIAPTIVGGSKKHGGADLGPTRAKRAWAELGVDGLGLADVAPGADWPIERPPRLTAEMVARLQGWLNDQRYEWSFTGRKTSCYRQIANAFPPPVAEVVGGRIAMALNHEGSVQQGPAEHRPLEHATYAILKAARGFVGINRLERELGGMDAKTILRQIEHLEADFIVEKKRRNGQLAFRLGDFKGFRGQEEHPRHERFAAARGRIS